MTKKWSVFIAIGMVVLFSCYCAGNTKEVTDGNFNTLKNTIEGANAGDIIKISGKYKFYSPITVYRAITILSENGAIFDGSNYSGNAIDINANGVALAGLTICNFSKGKDTDVGIIYVKKACEIKNLVFSNNCSGGSCIYVTDDGGSAVSAVVTDCTFSGNGAMNGESGGKGVIHITGTGMSTVVGCTVVSNSMCGVCIDKGGLMKNTVVAGNRSGVYIKKGTMLNCTVYGNDSPDAGSGLVMESGTAVNNIIYGNGGTTNALVKEGCTFNTNLVDVLPDVGVGNIAANPMLANPDALDFSLTISSPAINGGATLAEVPCDIAGVARPQAGAYDIGAYEFKADSVACGIVVMKSDWPQGSEPSVFSRVIGAPAGAQISYRWFLDGVELAGETGASVVLPQTLACGPHDMKLIVTVNGDVQPEVVRNGVITVLPTGGVPTSTGMRRKGNSWSGRWRARS